jgi:hypothetical protein
VTPPGLEALADAAYARSCEHPAAATGLLYPVWAMVAMAASVTTIFVNSIGRRPRLLFAAITSVGRHPTTKAAEPSSPSTARAGHEEPPASR